MARTKQILKNGLRLNDFIAGSVLLRTIPLQIVRETLEECGKHTICNR